MLRKNIVLVLAVSLFGFIALLGSSVLDGSLLKGIDSSGFNRENPTTPKAKESSEELKLLNKGKDISSGYSKQVLLDITYGPKEEDLGFEEISQDGLNHVTAPGAIDVGRNGDIYIADPAKEAIKVYSKNGKYLKKIQVTKDWSGDFGLDARGTVYILEPARVYKKEPGQDSFEPIGPALNEAHRLEVYASGNFSTLDKIPPPDDRLRIQIFDTQGKLLKTGETFEFEDEQGYRVYRRGLGSGPLDIRYLVSRDKPVTEELIYKPYLPDVSYGQHEYYYLDLTAVGFDKEGNFYCLRVIAPDIPIENDRNISDKESKTEAWMDIIDLGQGEISSVRLDAEGEKRRLGGIYQTPHFYAVDITGNIYQLQVNKQGTKVLKYSLE